LTLYEVMPETVALGLEPREQVPTKE
jgi:hypothetical protein